MLASVGCRDVMLPAYDQQIVVEGWIENGRPPIVILTTSVSVDGTPRDSTDLKELIIRWGKVTVSDGKDFSHNVKIISVSTIIGTASISIKK